MEEDILHSALTSTCACAAECAHTLTPPTHTSLSIVVHPCNISTWEAAAGVQGYPLAFKEFKANSEYIRPCLKRKKRMQNGRNEGR